MPQDAALTSEERSKPNRPTSEAPQTSSQWFTTPHSIRRLFDKFPLRIYPVNELPQRSPQNRDRHTLWIFTTDKGAQLGAPSFNPGCLKWQASLTYCPMLGDALTDIDSGLLDLSEIPRC